jgi:hypothetical protein
MVKVSHNGIHYNSKTKFGEYCKDLIYNRIGECDSVKDKSEDLFNEVLILLKRHPRYEEKIKNMKDIKFIQNMRNRKALECRIIYSDNTDKDISWTYARDSRLPSQEEYLTKALRSSVMFQIMNFKKNNDPVCTKCNSVEDLHCDHIIHFEKLTHDFLKIYNDKIPSEFAQLNDGSNFTCFLYSDYDFEDKWKEYHYENAKLRILCQNCNLTRAKSKVNKPN